jgi:histone H3/H4
VTTTGGGPGPPGAPKGHYSKDEMRKLKDAVVERLMRELEQAVARHLRVPGG